MYATICLLDIIYLQEPPRSLCHDSVSSLRCEPGEVTFKLQISPVGTTLSVALRDREGQN